MKQPNQTNASRQGHPGRPEHPGPSEHLGPRYSRRTNRSRTGTCLLILALFSFAGTAHALDRTPGWPEASTQTETPFAIRGFHIDLRVQVMTVQALKDFARELADFGMNTLVMEWEASYPYDRHATISNPHAYTRDEVRDFVAYCDSLGIEVIPLQQCFGHVEYILQHGRYNHLKESRTDLSQVCPLKVEENRALFTALFEDMASLHPSKYIHIGGDETRLLGHCDQCAAVAAAEGTGKLFADYLVMICDVVTRLGKIPVLWADIVLEYPEVVDRLPRETVYVDWNYGWAINRFGNVDQLVSKGLNFWGSPAIRSHPDNWYTTDWQKHFNNQRDFIPYARQTGYQGVVMTSWSTSGVYGYTWETDYEAIRIHPMRNVYPLSGFRILVASYAQAVAQEEPLDPREFVIGYAMERFGLSRDEGETLWQVLEASPALARVEDPEEVDAIRMEVRQAVARMGTLTPRSHREEFAHLQLMLDLRSFSLDVRKVESVYESARYDRSMAGTILPDLERLMEESDRLDERFTALNEGFLKPAELTEQNRIRSEKLRKIHAAVEQAAVEQAAAEQAAR
ncbi:MAG: family 20 glycosylhydrolase [Bacteroidales bacterium]